MLNTVICIHVQSLITHSLAIIVTWWIYSPDVNTHPGFEGTSLIRVWLDVKMFQTTDVREGWGNDHLWPQIILWWLNTPSPHDIWGPERNECAGGCDLTPRTDIILIPTATLQIDLSFESKGWMKAWFSEFPILYPAHWNISYLVCGAFHHLSFIFSDCPHLSEWAGDICTGWTIWVGVWQTYGIVKPC